MSGERGSGRGYHVGRQLNSFEQIVPAAGAQFLRIEDGSVYFQCPETGDVLTLYVSACTVENIALTLKEAREKSLGFPQLQLTDSLEF